MTREKEILFERICELLAKMPPDVQDEILSMMEETAEQNIKGEKAGQ